MSTKSLKDILDDLIELYWAKGAITCEVYTDVSAEARIQDSIDYIWECLENFYTPQQMVKVKAMVDQRVEEAFA